MRLQLYSILLFLCAIHGNRAYGQFFPVWQGFDQEWGYNHRVNRLGDFIRVIPGEGDKEHQYEWVHTAASGSGADSSHFACHAMWVEIKGADFQIHPLTLSIEGLEGEWIHDTTDWSFPIGGLPSYSWLSGFDLKTKEGEAADKFQYFRLAMIPEPDLRDDSLHVQVVTDVILDCSTAECPGNKRVSYDLDAYIAVLRLPFACVTSQDTVRNQCNWGRVQNAACDTVSVPLIRQNDFSFPTIRGFEIALSDEMHYQKLAMALLPLSPNQTNATKAMLEFQNWDESMYAAFKNNYSGKIKPPAKWVVKKSAGEADLAIYINHIWMKDAQFAPIQGNGRLFWHTSHGHQQPANGPAAEFHFPLLPQE